MGIDFIKFAGLLFRQVLEVLEHHFVAGSAGEVDRTGVSSTLMNETGPSIGPREAY